MSEHDEAFPMDIYDREHPTHRAWNFRPTGYLVVMLAPEQAERAETALASAGISPRDMKRYADEEIVANFEAYLKRLGAADKVVGVFLDDQEGRDRYVADAREGMSALWVRLPDPDRVPSALRALVDVEYRRARYYGDDSQTDYEVGR
jgi:hypothetical protein